MISASRLTRRFGDRIAIEDVTLEIGAGETVALLGPNGAGKTTTLRMLAGLIAPTSGSVAIDGARLTPASGTAQRARIGFLTEAPGLWDRLTVRENLTIYARLYGIENTSQAADRMLLLFGLTDRASTRAAELSKGMRQKVALARALMHEPRILLLDEPTSGLDPEIARLVRELLAERRAAGCSILVSTHNLDEAERVSDRIAVLNHRLLAVDTPAALRRRISTRRVFVRIAGDARAHLDAVRTFDAEAHADGATLTVRLDDIDAQTPALVSMLVARHAQIQEVRQEMAALEDVYLHLMDRR